jgi:hypothetical protein
MGLRLFQLALLLGLLPLTIGCATRIVPPANPSSPVTVYVTDYGRHSSLLLPTKEGHLVEYAYGDWHYYAMDQYRWYLGATALVYSEASGLGRRIWPHPANDKQLQQMLDTKRLIALEIDQRKVMELLNELDHRNNGHIETLVYNRSQAMYVVKDDTRYNFFHTCNKATASWLEKLGCEVHGFPLVSNFEVAGRQRVKDDDEPGRVAPPPVQSARGQSTAEPVRLSQ